MYLKIEKDQISEEGVVGEKENISGYFYTCLVQSRILNKFCLLFFEETLYRRNHRTF